MSEVTKPLMLDETGQAMVKAIEGLYIGKRVLININSISWGTVTGGGAYTSGSPVTLTAIPEQGCGFLAWKDASGNVLGTDTTYSFTILNDTIIQAIFIDNEVTEIVPWSTGDIQKIQAMVAAAYAGIIELSDYWSVGDTRTVNISAIPNVGGSGDEVWSVASAQPQQDIEFTIMDFNCKGFKLASDGVTTPKMIVGAKNGLSNTDRMWNSSGVYPSWGDCLLRNWCNYGFYGAIAYPFRSLFKCFRWKLYDTSTVTLVSYDDYFAFPIAKTVANGGWAQESELYDLWEWYLNIENRRKTPSGNRGWWLSSKYTREPFFNVITSSNLELYADFSTAMNTLSPFGCI